MKERYLESLSKQFEYYKLLGSRTFAQLEDEDLFREIAAGSNSIAVIVKHMSGNMKSRFTDFLTTDGEKEWRNRDQEFADDLGSRQEVIDAWESGWTCVFEAIASVTDLQETVYIRNQGHTVFEALNRQLAHYAYHVGQIVYVGKCCKANNWTSLSIPRNSSNQYNKAKFSQDKNEQHYTDEFLKG